MLTAPFALLGHAYKAQLRDGHTSISLADVLRLRYVASAILDNALTDISPLFSTISRFVNEAVLAAIAHGHAEGRLLPVGTTDLDAQEPLT